MSTKLIKSQQTILKGLGLYQGEIDGFWGKQSESAMAGFQYTEGFTGMKQRNANQFFTPFEELPEGWSWSADGTSIVTEDSVEEIEDTTEADAEVEAKRVKAEADAKADADALLAKAEEDRIAAEKVQTDALAAKVEEDRLAAIPPVATEARFTTDGKAPIAGEKTNK